MKAQEGNIDDGDNPSRVVLLGDSIFANAAYTHGGPDVLAHLRRVLPVDWRASAEALGAFVDRLAQFEHAYRSAIRQM